MKKIFKKLPISGKHLIAFFGCLAILSSFLVLPVVVGAAPDLTTNLQAVNTAAKLPGDTTGNAIWTYIGTLISILLGVLGVVLVVLIIWAGFIWMTSQGDKDKVTKAKGMITQAVIGLVIIFAAYALTTFVLTSLDTITGQQ